MENDRVKIAEERKLIAANLVNGVPMPRVMEAFHISEKDALTIFEYVARKVRSYRFARGMPFVDCQTIDKAQRNAAIVLHTLDRLNLDKDAKFGNINVVDLEMADTVIMEMNMRREAS